METIINYQGILADTTGSMSESISETGSLERILTIIREKYPPLEKLNFIVSVNGVISHGDIEISNGDHVTLIPPAPGG